MTRVDSERRVPTTLPYTTTIHSDQRLGEAPEKPPIETTRANHAGTPVWSPTPQQFGVVSHATDGSPTWGRNPDTITL